MILIRNKVERDPKTRPTRTSMNPIRNDKARTEASRPLKGLGCPTLHFLTSFLLSDTDLMALRCWSAEERDGLTPTAWCRSLLHIAIQCRPAVAAQVGDLLDLRHVDDVLAVRAAGVAALRVAAGSAFLEKDQGRGLTWALVTDPRDEVHALGKQLITETYVRAVRDFGVLRTS